MANLDQKVGLSPSGEVKRVREYVAASAIYPGDALKLDSGGKVAVAAAGDAQCGVAASYASAADAKVLVYDHPEQEFKVQASGAEIDAQTDINLNYDLLANSPDSVYKKSKHELDSSTGATTATLPFKLLRIDPRADNALGSKVDCIVIINNHAYKGGTGTVGV